MKKVLLYTDTPQIGGAELQIFLLAKFLNKEEFKPILACSNYRELDDWCKKFETEAIEVIRLNVSHKHDPRHLFNLKKIIKARDIEIIHAHIWNPASCRYAFSAAKSTKTPLIITEHDPFKLSKIKDYFKKSALKKTKKIITVSAQNAKVLKELYPDQSQKISVIHNGIDTDWWQSQTLRFTQEQRQEIKEKIFHAKEDTLIIATIAELHERKGLKYAIEAIKPLINRYPNIKLVLIGGGKQEKELRNLVEKLELRKNVTIAGKQKRIPKLLKASDIFLLPSRREAFGFVNLEAMICELPVVATSVGGIPEIVNLKTGILVDAENQQEITQALIKMIESEELRHTLGKSGKDRVLKEFTAKIMAQKYEKIYREA